MIGGMISGITLQTAANHAAFASAHNQFQESLAAQRSQAANGASTAATANAAAAQTQTSTSRDIAVSHLSAASGLQAAFDARNGAGSIDASVTSVQSSASALGGAATYNYLGNIQPNHAGTGKVFSGVA